MYLIINLGKFKVNIITTLINANVCVRFMKR